MKLLNSEKTLGPAALKAGMDEKTARKYRNSSKLPSQVKAEHIWRTRPDPFADVWEDISAKLEQNPGFFAKTLFHDLQRRYPGSFADGQLRTLQRKIKVWRALNGPGREVFFPQVHEPGKLCQSDFTHMTKLGITIAGQSFDHMIYHFVLTYSNWETGSICFSESFESLSEGFQDALWELGGIPLEHCTDRLSSAVNKLDNPEEFTRRYTGLLGHYGIKGRKIQTGKANENGDVEQRHRRFKEAVDQALMLRGHRDFASREEYEKFLRDLFGQLNAGRDKRFAEETEVLRSLPSRRLDDFKKIEVSVGRSSSIRAGGNVYSVHSRLIGEKVQVRLYSQRLEVWYAQRKIETIPRIRGKSKSFIQYRHIIDWLVRKPGAFENYRYRDDLFPTSRFRMAYDWLADHRPAGANKEYLKILDLAAKESETGVDEALRKLIGEEKSISFESVETVVRSGAMAPAPTEVTVNEVDLSVYDELLECEAASV